MNILKATPALAVALLSPYAAAQSNVTLYGILDACVVSAHGTSAAGTQANSGCAYGSRFGFRGQEDLGGGLKADFTLESGISLDNGTLAQNGRLFGRKALVGLITPYGQLHMGRDYAPTFYLVRPVDPYKAGIGSATTMVSTSARPDGSGRNDNSIVYTSPRKNGYGIKASYALGEHTATSTTTRDAKGVLFSYESDKLLAGVAYNATTNATGRADDHTATIGASVKTGFFQPAFLFQVGKWEGTRSVAAPSLATSFFSRDYRSAMVGATFAFGPGRGNLIATYKRYDDKTVRNFDADQVTVGHKYQLSKRTELYAVYTRQSNKGAAAYGLMDATNAFAANGAGTAPSAFYLGITHIF